MPYQTASGTILAVETPLAALNELAKIEGYSPEAFADYCKTLSGRSVTMYGKEFSDNPETLAAELVACNFLQKV